MSANIELMASEEYVNGKVAGLYTKPGNGIPASDFSSEVQSSLGKADTALQQHQDITGKADKSEMSVTPGTGADADKTTIQLKNGTSATVLVSHQSLASCVTGGSYDSTNKKILLKHGNSTLAEIDATAFIKDGMVSGVAIVNVPDDETPTGLSNGDYLKITFNTDAGTDPIYIPLADIFNPSNYYTKTTADAKFVAQVSGKGLSTNDYDATEKGKVASALQPADIVDPAVADATGKAADAKATGDALALRPTKSQMDAGWWSEWSCEPATYGGEPLTIRESDDYYTIYVGDSVDGSIAKSGDEDSLVFHAGMTWSGDVDVTATRHRVCAPVPTKPEDIGAQPAGSYASPSDIGIPAFSTTATYAIGAKVVYDNALWNCTTAVSTAGAWSASNWTKLFDLDTGAPASGGTKFITNGQAYTALQDKADAAALRYDLGTAQVIDSEAVETDSADPENPIDYGEATLADRTANYVQITAAIDELRIVFPAAVSGKIRDFELRVEVGTGSAALTAPALVVIAPTGETIKPENPDGAMPALADGAADAKGVTLLYFSENPPAGTFLVKGETVQEVA